MGPCYIEFPGLFITQAEMTLSHGVSPSQCVLTCVPTGMPVNVGQLNFYLDGMLAFSFPDCAIDQSLVARPQTHRGARSVVRVLDRRWKWKGKRVDGRYNIRCPDSRPHTGTEATYKELLEKLLESLGESDYELQLLYPDLNGPTVHWSGAHPDLELAKLVDEIGAVVFLGLDNRVHITMDGQGTPVQTTGRERHQEDPVLRQTFPYWAQTTFGLNRYQSKLKLEAVGLDNTGEVLPIDSLSYKPSGGWASQVPGIYNNVTDVRDRELARQTVYKWYRVKSQADDSVTLPGRQETITSISDILPLLPELIMPQYRAQKDAPQDWENWPPATPTVEGYFWNNDITGLPEIGDNANPEYAKWDDSFELDLERGIVKFSQFVFLVESGGHQKEAELYLECAYSARPAPDSPEYYWNYRQQTGASKDESTGTAEVRRPDMFRYIATRYKANSADEDDYVTNQEDIDKYGQQMTESFAQHYLPIPHSNMQWVGILPIAPSGRVHQVRWTAGAGAAMTYACSNTENGAATATFVERRLYEESKRVLPGVRQ